jgi:anti-sigma regulatory factor (Ser/Thr protein kinase)
MTSPDRPIDPIRQGPAGPEPEAAAVDAAVDFTFDVTSLYMLRATVAAHASRMGAAGDQLDHLLIVAGELASNAIRHGGGTGRIRLWRGDGAMFCQVADFGPGFTDPTVGTTQPDPDVHDGGRGIWICRNLTAHLVIDAGPDGRGAIVTAAVADGHFGSS